MGAQARSAGGARRGTLIDTAEGRAEHLVAGTTVATMDHERMNHGDDREARTGGGVADRGPATIGVPAQDPLVGQAQAPHGLRTRGEFHAPGRHLENVRSAGGVEHVWPLQEMRECLAVLTIADEAKAAGRRDVARNATHAAAPTPKRDVQRQARHVNASDHESAPGPIPLCWRTAVGTLMSK